MRLLRDKFNKKLREFEEIRAEYIKELKPDEHGIYITEHAIVRYLERVKGIKPPNGKSDYDKLNKLHNVHEIRKEMLNIEEDRAILIKGLKLFRREGTDYAYIVDGLRLITVIKINLR